jgi:protein-disulfide isomerase
VRTHTQLGRLLLSILTLSLLSNHVNAQSTRPLETSTLQVILAGRSPTPPAGAIEGDVTIIEYFDYNCPVCRHLEPELRRLLTADRKIRLVRKDWPVFGEASEYAAYCSYAAAREGRYPAAHDALISSHRDLDSKEDVKSVLRSSGFDVQRLDADILSHAKDYGEVLMRNQRETAALGLRGTPGLIVGHQLVTGSVDYAGLERLVARERADHRSN